MLWIGKDQLKIFLGYPAGRGCFILYKKFFLLFLTAAALAGGLALAYPSLSAWGTGRLEETQPARAEDILHLRQIITADSGKTRTIMWESLDEEAQARVEVRQKGAAESEAFMAEAKRLQMNGKVIYTYRAQLSGLTAAQYEYRVGYGKRFGAWQAFSVESEKESFKAIIFPDSQSNGYGGWKDIAAGAWRSNPEAQFFVNLGDLVDNGYDLAQWDGWFEGVGVIGAKIPFAPVMGNHETYTLDWKVDRPRAYLHFFDVPSNGSMEDQNQYYSFDYGDVHFVVLNSQEEELRPFWPGLFERQAAWLRKDLMSSEKKWKVVLLHKDILHYAKASDAPSSETRFTGRAEKLMPIFDEFAVDAVLTAHLHTYRRRVPLYNFQPDEKGTLYLLTGIAGNVRYPGLWQEHPLDRKLAPQPETDNYIVLEAKEDSLTFSAYLSTGEMFDQVKLEK